MHGTIGRFVWLVLVVLNKDIKKIDSIAGNN
jgi:hypothetical protein